LLKIAKLLKIENLGLGSVFPQKQTKNYENQ